MLLFIGCEDYWDNYFLNIGKKALLKEDYDTAIDFFSRQIRENPKSTIAYFGRGVAQIKKGECQSAYSDFTKAIELDFSRSVDYLTDVMELIEKNNLENDLYSCINQLTTMNNDPGVDFFIGHILHVKGIYNKAITFYDEALSGYKDKDHIYVCKARIWYFLDDYYNTKMDLLNDSYISLLSTKA